MNGSKLSNSLDIAIMIGKNKNYARILPINTGNRNESSRKNSCENRDDTEKIAVELVYEQIVIDTLSLPKLLVTATREYHFQKLWNG